MSATTDTTMPRPKLFSGSFLNEWDKVKRDIRNLFRLLATAEPVGSVKIFAGQTIPDGYLFADGTIYNISDYPDLGAYLGNIWGGNGTTTFGVPNLTGSTYMEFTSLASVGTSSGSNTHTHPLSDNGAALITLGSVIFARLVSASGARTATATATGFATTSPTTGALNSGAGLTGTTDSTDGRPKHVTLAAAIKF